MNRHQRRAAAARARQHAREKVPVLPQEIGPDVPFCLHVAARIAFHSGAG
jgi:hypothetical protein